MKRGQKNFMFSFSSTSGGALERPNNMQGWGVWGCEQNLIIVVRMSGGGGAALTERGGEKVEGNLAENDVTAEKEVWIMMEGGRVFDWRGGGVAA